MKTSLIITCIKLGNWIIRYLKIGHGSTWPGHIALGLNRNILKNVIKNNPECKVILVSGTNGKTTTSLLITHILSEYKIRVLHNDSGANLLNGVASKILLRTNFNGRIPYDYLVLEVDENSLENVIKNTNPYAIVLLNLFRDQLDRYGEVNTIAKKWQTALSQTSKKTLLFANADDPQIKYLSECSGLNDIYYFTVDKTYFEKKKLSHDVDSTFCPKCRFRLTYDGIVFSHLGNYRCVSCGFKRGNIQHMENLTSPLNGIYNMYNLGAASLVSSKLLDISSLQINKTLKNFRPAFGRQEVFTVNGKAIKLMLSKNPTGFNQSLETILDMKKQNDTLLVLLNDRIPDGKDISWIWDVDFEKINNSFGDILLSGDRKYDLGVRFKYAEIETASVEKHFKSAIEKSLRKTKVGSTIFILATYSAMLEVRDFLEKLEKNND